MAEKEATPSEILSRLRADPATGIIYYCVPGHAIFGAAAVRAFKREMKAALAKEEDRGVRCQGC